MANAPLLSKQLELSADALIHLWNILPLEERMEVVLFDNRLHVTQESYNIACDRLYIQT